ncbi:hypothetical protein [Streptomyces sp. NPDC089799]|uniref:hypothetical protein n=1 Tax=Streptomyces sp. NPDC089799 TaxID=3155066 RepID=UPI003434932C
MATTVVGFRMGCDVRARQITVMVSHTGVLYRSNGPYGKAPALGKPELSPALYGPPAPAGGEHPLARPIASLRKYHAQCLENGYTRVLIPPGTAVLDVDERLEVPVPAPDRRRPRLPHRELAEAFVGEAPCAEQSLEEAIRAFRKLLGLPNRSLPQGSVPQGPVPDRGGRGGGGAPLRPPPPLPSLPPRAQALARMLVHGQVLSSPRDLAVGWTVSGDSVRLHAGHTGQHLSRAAAAELHAALGAWLSIGRPGS